MYDVIVVGCGCAGASVSFFLKYFNRDLNVVLVERLDDINFNKYHEKCGEGVSDAFFKEISPIKKETFIRREMKRSIEYFGNESRKMGASGYIINRPMLLHSIMKDFETRGGSIIFDEFINFEENEIGTLQVMLKSGRVIDGKMLIGCDGANSRVRNRLKINNPELKTVVQYVIKSENNEFDSDAAKIWYDAKYKGSYKYQFPSEDGFAKIGFELGTDVYLGKFDRKQARQIAVGGLDCNPNSRNVILIGDAAGECNPITCGGIRVAFVQGKLLAKHVVLGKPLHSFQEKWNKSRYASKRYISSRDTFALMNNDEIHDFMKPGIKELLLKFKTYWTFMQAEKYGW